MKLIVDAHLPKSICEYFLDCDCIHTQQLEEGNLTKDSFINKLSLKEHRVVITKDTDFYYSFIASHKPYKLVLVKLGNMRLEELKNYFKANRDVRQIPYFHALSEKRFFYTVARCKNCLFDGLSWNLSYTCQ